MRQPCYFAPHSEHWVIAEVTRSVVTRLSVECANPDRTRSLMRLLFGLQRFPRITPGLLVQLSWKDMEDYGLIALTPDDLTIELAHTRLQYFVGSHHLIRMFDILSGLE